MASNLAVTEVGTKADSAALATSTITAAAAVPRGALIVLAIVSDSASTVGTATDARGNTYKSTAALQTTFNTSADRLLLFVAYVTTAIQVGDLISYANGSGTSFKQMQALAITGQAWGEINEVMDKNPAAKANQATGTALSATVMTPTQLDEVVIAAYGYAGAGTFTPTAPDVQTGITNKVTSNSFNLAMTYRIVTTAAAVTPAATLGTTGVWAAVALSLRASMARQIIVPTIVTPVLRASYR